MAWTGGWGSSATSSGIPYMEIEYKSPFRHWLDVMEILGQEERQQRLTWHIPGKPKPAPAFTHARKRCQRIFTGLRFKIGGSKK